MSELRWRSEPPDSAGVWLYRAAGSDVRHICEVEQVPMPHKCASNLEWCRIADIPVIAEPIKYREPTIADWGKACEFSDNGIQWTNGVLRGIRTAGFISDRATWLYARIVDDGKQPREWWMSLYPSGCIIGAYPSIDMAERAAIRNGGEVVKVREVLE